MKQEFVREIQLTYKQPSRPERFFVSGPESCANFIRSILPDNVKEHFVVLILDGAHTVVSYQVITTGLANVCQVHPREVFQPAILAGAVAVIVAHNHPTGDTKESKEDLQVTKRLKDAGTLLGVKVLDSLIVTEDNFNSIIEAV